MESKGSVTVFFSLSLLMLMSLIFSLIEVVHYTGLERNTVTVSKIGTESIFGDYNRFLWDEYGILAVDAGYGQSSLNITRLETRVTEYVTDNINPVIKSDGGILGDVNELINSRRSNFMRANPAEVKLSRYGLMTDDGGAAFIKESAKQVFFGIPEAVIGEWQDKVNSINGASGGSDVDDLLAGGTESLEEAMSAGQTMTTAPSDALPPPPVDNPMENAMSWKSRAVLSQVIKDVSSVSTVAVSREDRPSVRSINIGNAPKLDAGMTDKLLCGLYLKDNFSNYRTDRNHPGFKYEWEYVLNGKESDDKNLEATVSTLLALREAQNMIAIAMDGARTAEAYGLAAAMCFAAPYLIEPVKWGILAAWAYLESVLDVRLLLQGGKVPIIKTPAEWTSDIFLFATYLDPSITARSTGHGMSYEDYLMALTVVLSEKRLGMRALDVLERALHGLDDYAGCRVDNFIYCGAVDYTYSASPIFASVMPMLSGRLGGYEFKRREALSYI